MLHWMLAQTFPADVEAATQPARGVVERTYDVPWDKWFTFYNWQVGVRSIGALVLLLLLGSIITRVFRNQLNRHQLMRPTRLALVVIAVYACIFAGHPYRMMDPYDVLALILNKSFVAILLWTAVRYFDRLVILPLLARISGGVPSRFIHQIVVAVVSVFVLAGYCSWAFGVEISSFLAGSAVISIVLGLALQETLGNFFSGMVLQASVPFKAGDWVRVGDIEGRVVEMTWRAVTLLTAGNNHTLIPNSIVAKERIVNYNAPSSLTVVSVEVGLDYAIPPNEAKRMLVQAALDVPAVLRAPAPTASLTSYGDSSIVYKVFFRIDRPAEHFGIEETVRSNLWYRVNQAGMSIPFPVRTVELTDTGKRQARAAEAARALRLQAIKSVPMFSSLAAELQEQLSDDTRDFLLGAGQTLYQQGDHGDSLFVLQSGTMTRTIHTEDGGGRDIDAGDITAPALTGEGSALTGKTRGATLRAKTDVRVIEVDQEHLRGLFTREPALMKQFSEAVAARQTEIEEMLRQMGATPTAAEAETHAETVLSRMRRLFSFGRGQGAS
jgi:small-conductance mechanosensitive channel/CRP-like cAMP-binding protein